MRGCLGGRLLGTGLAEQRHQQGRSDEGQHDGVESIGVGERGCLAVGEMPQRLERRAGGFNWSSQHSSSLSD